MISASQFEQRHQSLSAIAKKVYQAVPAKTAWSPSFILSEMQRTGSSTRDLRIIEGCLNSLIDAGLVEEPGPRVFIRAPIKAPKEPPTSVIFSKEELVIEKPQATAKPIEARTPITILSSISVRIKALADELETAALEIEEQIAAKDADAGKLKQLQALLKGLT